jgi:hypothetical protein
MSPSVKDIKDLDNAIAEDQSRIAEITGTIAHNQRKRNLMASDLTAAEKDELNPAPAAEDKPADKADAS